MFSFAPAPARRKPSLTPMIDVVFLLLVFFMLAARFGAESGIDLATATGGAAYDGPPRLVQITETGLRLNGQPVTLDALPAALAPLMSEPGDIVVLQAQGAAPLQDLVSTLEALRAAGLTDLVVVE